MLNALNAVHDVADSELGLIVWSVNFAPVTLIDGCVDVFAGHSDEYAARLNVLLRAWFVSLHWHIAALVATLNAFLDLNGLLLAFRYHFRLDGLIRLALDEFAMPAIEFALIAFAVC